MSAMALMSVKHRRGSCGTCKTGIHAGLRDTCVDLIRGVVYVCEGEGGVICGLILVVLVLLFDVVQPLPAPRPWTRRSDRQRRSHLALHWHGALRLGHMRGRISSHS